jgi:hypothetical protein
MGSQEPVILATWEAEIQRIMVQGQSGLYLQKNHLNNELEVWLKCRAFALQMWSPELKTQSLKKEKKKKKKNGEMLPYLLNVEPIRNKMTCCDCSEMSSEISN